MRFITNVAANPAAGADGFAAAQQRHRSAPAQRRELCLKVSLESGFGPEVI
jgi:hypothetical protein